MQSPSQSYFKTDVLAPSPLRITTRDVFTTGPCGNSPYVEDGLVSYEYTWPFVKCTYSTCSMLLKILAVALYTSQSSISSCFAKQIIPILRILCYNGSLATWTVVSLTTAKFKPLIFCRYSEILILAIQPRQGPHRKRLFHYCVFSRCRGI
jgi:hypothetical protein